MRVLLMMRWTDEKTCEGKVDARIFENDSRAALSQIVMDYILAHSSEVSYELVPLQ